MNAILCENNLKAFQERLGDGWNLNFCLRGPADGWAAVLTYGGADAVMWESEHHASMDAASFRLRPVSFQLMPAGVKFGPVVFSLQVRKPGHAQGTLIRRLLRPLPQRQKRGHENVGENSGHSAPEW